MTERPHPSGASAPTALDRAICYAFPGWGARRLTARAEMSYRGGVATRLSESYARQRGMRFGVGLDRWDLMRARDRGYQAYRNNPVARTIVDTETDNVIGDGLNFEPATKSPAFNAEAKDRWYEWLDEADVAGRMTGAELQRAEWTLSRVAGDAGCILVDAGTPDRIVSRLQLVPSENIVTPDAKLGAADVVDGVEYDAAGRPVAYHVLDWDERGRRTFARVPARDFVHLAHRTHPSQARGETCYLTVFDLLAHLDRYVDGVSLAAWMATVFGIVFKQAGGAKEMQGLGLVTDAQGQQKRGIVLENGSVKYVGRDDEVAQVQASQPMQQTPDFIVAMLRQIGMPFDMPLEVIAKDMSRCTFASARIGLLPFYRSCRTKVERLRPRWHKRYRWWLSREVNRPRSDPRRFRSAVPADFWRLEILPNAWDYTDPVSEAQGDFLQIDMGIKSPQQVIAERGRSAEQIVKDRLAWAELTKELPTLHSTMTRHPQLGVGPQGDPLGKEQAEPAPSPAAPAGTDGDTDDEETDE